MSKFLDFEQIKQDHPIEDVAAALKLVLKPGNNQLRGPCPTCAKGGDRALVITPGKKVFYCFSAAKGGDVIALAAHILDKPVKQAAEWICGGTGTAQDTSTSAVKSRDSSPESERHKETQKFQPLAYLEPENPAVDAVGFDLAFAKAHGIGYAPKGILRGSVAVPFRDEEGNLLGYIGITEAKLPPSFTGNVVPFGKKTA